MRRSMCEVFLVSSWKNRERPVVMAAMAAATQTTPRRRPWGLTFFGLVAAAALVAMPFIAGEPGGREMPDIVRFLGHFHPAVLHLPIGVFVLILLQELGLIFFRRGREGGDIGRTRTGDHWSGVLAKQG